MTPAPHHPDRWPEATADDEAFVALVGRYLDGAATAEDAAELNRQLASDPRRIALLAALTAVDQTLRDGSAGARSDSPLRLAPGDVADAPRSTGRRWALAAAVIVGAALVAVVLAVWQAQQETGGDDPGARVAQGPVATVIAAESVAWSSEPLAEGRAVDAGVIEIEDGQLTLHMHRGALVALAGPARLDLTGDNGAFLHRGALRADVPPSAHGFTVHAPGGVSVTDLGTVFEMSVDPDAGTLVSVIDGEVALQAGGTRVTLTDGTARGVDRAGRLVDAESIALPVRVATASIDLASVVAQASGATLAEGSGIDVNTGAAVRTQTPGPGPTVWAQTPRYHHVVDSPLIDGVFVPHGGDVVVNSAGHRFDGFGQTLGVSWGHLWSGADPIDGASPESTVIAGVDYNRPPHRMLFMHSSKGVTFDLDALRAAHPGRRLLRLRGVAACTKEPDDSAAGAVGFFVLVDGAPRLARPAMRFGDEPIQLRIDLHPGDRFLTLAVTDGGDGTRFDWVILGDARIETAGAAHADAPDTDIPAPARETDEE